MEGRPPRSHRSGLPHPPGRAVAPQRRGADRAAGRAAPDRDHDGLFPRPLRLDPRKEGRAGAGRGRAHAADRAEVHRRHARPAQRRDLERAVRGPCRSTTASRSRRAAEAVKSRITNIQVDGSENLSDPDAAKRAASVETIKRLDGSRRGRGRANLPRQHRRRTGRSLGRESHRRLVPPARAYGKKIGVKILVENHIGYSADIDKVVAIIKAVNDPVLPRHLRLGQQPVTKAGSRRSASCFRFSSWSPPKSSTSTRTTGTSTTTWCRSSRRRRPRATRGSTRSSSTASRRRIPSRRPGT